MSAERFTLDTNILFYYYVDVDAGQRHERAMQIVERAVATESVVASAAKQSRTDFHTNVRARLLRCARNDSEWLSIELSPRS